MLKNWYKADPTVNPLKDLYLVQQASKKWTSDPYEASRQVLLQSLDKLAVDAEEDALLLRWHFLERLMMSKVANRLHLAEPTAYKRQQRALRRLALVLQELERQARASRPIQISGHWWRPAESPLVGADDYLRALLKWTRSTTAPWLISVEGLGGIGKTSLTNRLVGELVKHSHFEDIAWISARRAVRWIESGFEPVTDLTEPVLDVETLVEMLLDQLGDAPLPAQSAQEKFISLNRLLKDRVCLVVIDNLETEADYEALLPTLQKLANPSKFVLTSRNTLRHYSDVSCLLLSGLSQEDTVDFLRQEAASRQLEAFQQASQAQLEGIYQVVGGNPLALKLVVGQASVLPLSQVLDSLRQAQGKEVDELYTYIYWQAWQNLDEFSRQLLLVMPLAQGGGLDQLEYVSCLQGIQLRQALQKLVTHSLVITRGDLEKRRYTIHRLTETFLLNEVIKWQ
jgi:hypothetical protein